MTDTNSSTPAEATATADKLPNRPLPKQRLLYVVKLFVQPLLFLGAGLLLLVVLGLAQRMGWISSGGNTPHATGANGAQVDYICPMMCTPPQQEPGRCPVCAMELVPATGGEQGGDERSIVVDPATRRVANIQTVQARAMARTRKISTVGELRYDEGKMSTITAYTQGRFDQIYVNYTGANVQAGDRLASFFSPKLYSAQVEFLQAVKAFRQQNRLTVVADSDQRLFDAAKQRLIELGMSDQQIAELQRTQTPLTRLDIVAPIHGTVIEKLIVEGDSADTGQPLFRLADLTTVWLMLELFPDAAASVKYGQGVTAQLRSLPGQEFLGRIAFIDPEVDRSSRTVRVRVVLDNSAGQLRVGDYAQATIEVPLGSQSDRLVYDPDLANKWISPRHPHIIRDEPGPCPQCGVELVSAKSLGFIDTQPADNKVVVIPRSAVLTAANESVVYVEVESGRFEIRRVTLGPTTDDLVVVAGGIKAGENVAIRGNFLIDSQMQFAGNPSLIDPTRAATPTEYATGLSRQQLAEIQQLPDEERTLAIAQKTCPVTDGNLGSMGVPPKVLVNDTLVFLCCEGCRKMLLKKPDYYLQKIQQANDSDSNSESAPSEIPAEVGADQ